VLETTAIGVTLLMLAIVGGGLVQEGGGSLAEAFTLSPEAIALCLIAYGFLASVLPCGCCWRRATILSTFMKIGVIALLAIGIIVTLPSCRTSRSRSSRRAARGPVFAGALFPFVFITIACGALSGFHSLIASGTTPKMIQKEGQVRMIGYGAMLMESFVAIMALIAASILDPGPVLRDQRAGRASSATPSSPPPGGRRARLHDLARGARGGGAGGRRGDGGRPHGRGPDARDRHGRDLLDVTGSGMKAFWYHFAIMFEALFILTTVDAGTRVGRFMLQDTLGNVWKPIGRVSWKPGLYATSAIVVGAWGWFLYSGVTNPLGGINQLFPLFGIANQLLAAVALTVATTLIIKSGRVKWAWVTGVPLAFDLAVTLTASYQKVFSDDPKLGFFAQRDKFKDALDQGEVLAPAKSIDDMNAVVTNSTVDGVLAALFAVLIVIVVTDAARIWVKALRSREPLPSTETPFVESQLDVPSGLLDRKPLEAGAA
jgi:carbon starvation protein